MLKKFLSITLALLITLAFMLPVNIYATMPEMIMDGGYVAHVIGFDKTGEAIYQVDLGIPTYCDDLVTPIDTQWYEQKDGSFKSGDNKYSSTVSNEQILIEDGAEYIKWTPQIKLAGADKGKDLKLNTRSVKAEILNTDPMNENYHRNTLVWHYDNGIDRYFRLIEGQCQEYFVINNELSNDLVIEPNAQQTKNFTHYEKAVAYDDLGTGIKLSEDQNKKITVKATSIKETSVTDGKLKILASLYDDEIKEAQQEAIANGLEPEVKYPVVIDPNYSFTSSTNDGHVSFYSTDYNSTWTQGNGLNAYTVDTYTHIGQRFSISNYFIYRSAVYFDTSALSSSITITGATLRLYGYIDSSTTDFNITMQQGGNIYPHEPLLKSDYDKSNYSTTSVGVLSTVGFSTTGYNTLTFNAADYSMINKTGTTKLFLRSSRDIAGTAPSGDEYVTIRTAEAGVGLAPILTVTFTAANPAISAVAATDVSVTTAQLNANITDDGGEIDGDTEVRYGYGTTELLAIGTFANNTGTATPTGAVLSGGFTEATYRTRTFTVTVAGTFDITLPAGVTGTATSGTATLAGSPVALAAGATTTVDTGVTVGNFTVEITNTYDTVTAWVSGYKQGDNPLLIINGLTGNTDYYFRVQAKNTTAVASSTNELTFKTANGIADVTYFTGLPSNTSISLNWVRPTGASGVLIRYGDSSCPATIVDGTQVYPEVGGAATSSSYVFESLTAGKTYYLSIWGSDAGFYSTNPKTLTLTTLGVSSTEISGGDTMDAPVLPASFFAPVNNTALENFEPFYSIINDFAMSWGMPATTAWLIIVLILIAFIGVIILIETRHLMPAVFVSSVLMLGASFMQLLPAYFIAIAIMISLGAWGMERNN